MAFAKIKMEQLQEFQAKAQDFDKVINEIMKKYLVDLSMNAIAYAKENTNVITGILRGAYCSTDVFKNGETYSVIIYNQTEYASFHEYGHRNPKGWTQGRFALTKGIEHSEEHSEEILNSILQKKLEELFDGE